uniref:Uncharacterized protein n=1 Tax=Coccolithus braarudii TaxID=221442 RepID=A0A7S0L2P2_9EUKA
MAALLAPSLCIMGALIPGSPRSVMSTTEARCAAGRPRVMQGGMPGVSRRAAFGLCFGSVALLPLAATAAQDAKDLTRLPKGLKEIDFLLDNWSQETINPVSGNADPDRVRLFLGLRTTTHPLFQVEKILTAAQNKVDPDDFEAWIEAVEGWDSHLNKVNELAYTSSFGEYNPGGGKDQIAKYLELAREEVILARASLAKIIGLLGL